MASVSQSARAAFEHTERILFQPFDLGKWFGMGFCAFLANLSGGMNANFRGSGKDFEPAFPDAMPWIQAHLPWVIALGSILLVILLTLVVLCLWLSSRGSFMLLDGIVQNRGAVKEPWHRFRDLGNDLFRFQLQVMIVVLVGAMIIGAFGAIGFHHHALPTLALILLLAIPACLAVLGLVLFMLILHDFAVPLMYRLELSTREALHIFREEFLSQHLGTFVVFYLLKLVIGIAGIALFIAIGCLTCCIGFLPYLSSVLSLPLTVFFRCYALDLLAQLDPRLNLLTPLNQLNPMEAP